MSFRRSGFRPRLKTRRPARWAHVGCPPHRRGRPQVVASHVCLLPLGEPLLLRLLLSEAARGSTFQNMPPVWQVPGAGVAHVASERHCGILLKAVSSGRTPRCAVPHRRSVFYRSEVWGHPASGKSKGVLSSKAFAHLVSPCHILGIIAVL